MSLTTDPTNTDTIAMQPFVLAAGLTTYQKRIATGRHAEAVVVAALTDEGYKVTDLNELTGNCALADLLAIRGKLRVMVQVKGATITDYSTPPSRAIALKAFAAALDCKAAYALVQFSRGSVRLRFGTADDVERLAAEAEARYSGTNRYHVGFDEFSSTVADLPILLG